MNRRYPVGNVQSGARGVVGRQHDLAELRRLLSSARLVTLVGVCGAGKTTLALQLASEVRRAFVDGVWHVDLAPVLDGAQLESAVAAVLPVSARVGSPLSTAITEFARDRRLLLVLDNCEHLVQSCATFVGSILRAAGRMVVLCTSRQPLRVAGEYLWPVATLEPPYARDAALELFAQRATAADPGFAITEVNLAASVQICRQLDGLPLAIELAAARLRTLSVDELAAKLDDGSRAWSPGRGRREQRCTLRAAFDRSFELCTGPEQTLWTRMSVFTDGFDLAAAEYVCRGDGLAVTDMLECLAGLVDKSILVREASGPTRYRLLNTVRRHGLDRLGDVEGAENALRRRHRDWYVRLAERFAASWWGPGQDVWLARLRSEHANLSTALGYCLVVGGAPRTGLQLAVLLHRYYACCSPSDGRRWLEQALAADVEPSRARAAALVSYCGIAALQGVHCVDESQECLALARRLDDGLLLAAATDAVARSARLAGDLPRARQAAQEAVARFEALGERSAASAAAYTNLALCALVEGDAQRSAAVSAACRELCEASGDMYGRAGTHVVSARAALLRGRAAQAREHVDKSLRLRRRLHDVPGLAESVECQAWVAAALGEHERAARLLGAARQLWRGAGRRLGAGVSPGGVDEGEARVRKETGDAGFARAYQIGAGLSRDDAVADALGETEIRAVRPAPCPVPLTAREWQVARSVASGLSNRQIADRLVVGQRTVEGHVESIMRKLGLTSRTQVAIWVVEQQER